VYGYPLSYVWEEGLWPPGLLDILVIAAFCYLGYRCYRRWREGKKPPQAEPPPKFLRQGNKAPPALKVLEEAKPGLAAIQETGQDFDLQVFGEEVLLLLVDLYYAWNREEVNNLNGRVKESLLEYLQMGLKIMSLREERSYLEEMILEGISVTAAGVNDGKEHITVCFRGRLLDYVLDRKSGKLLLGSMAYPATFQEYWYLERPRGESAWVLQDIREM
jgi:predicted lipid-binding transport protein (Tim44 family)